ncbi:MAG: hypothetical protein JRN29_02970, partial [Nitrososphaerota archaeon]|nr:hypothetical protein [Nitrososphaerota archaeon]
MIIDEEPSLPELEGYLSPETIPNLYLIYDARRELGKRARFRAAVGPGGVEGVSLLYRGNPYTSVWILGTERAAEGLLEGEPVQRVIVCTQPPLAGLVESRQGIGTVVRDPLQATDPALVLRALVAAGPELVAEVLEVRRVLGG